VPGREPTEALAAKSLRRARRG